MKTNQITHKVLDLHYSPDEGQECFEGTLDECEEFLSKQSPHFMYTIVTLSPKEKATYETKNF